MRLFIAADLSDEQKNIISFLQKELKVHFRNVKWVEPEALHITLKFLGEIEMPTDELIDLLNKSVIGFDCFELSIKGLGFFRIIFVHV